MAYPDWLRQLLRSSPGQAWTPTAARLEQLVQSLHLKTICQTARCPNLGHCWSRGTATFLILGDICTRGCRFCNLRPGHPQAVDDDEPWRLLQAVRELRLRHIVITAVTRDDLPDGGAAHFCRNRPGAAPGRQASHYRSLDPGFPGPGLVPGNSCRGRPGPVGPQCRNRPPPLSRASASAPIISDLSSSWLGSKTLQAGITTKSGLMLGLGETPAEVAAVLQDLRQAGVDHLTLGQYLAPSPRHVPVARYVTPAEFAAWGQKAATLGFASVQSGPLVRSSYSDTLSAL